MASTLGRPMVIEGGPRAHSRTEIMDMTTFEWSDGPTQTIHQSGGYWGEMAIIQRDEDLFYLAGGILQHGGLQTAIGKYEGGIWTKIGDLLSARLNPGLVFNGANQLLAIGGWNPNESLSILNR